ncbi:hypothetical protein J5S49_06840 [Virgibacillus halodenitrificans]|nr:hypothetical protein [Virgibacillus halodenitrificans]MCG1028002.1 hypothetical protein [Virgibacillus halodenitrificans]MEC2159392.1 hypothetical protein [Virgibacillus halodenitrificans]
MKKFIAGLSLGALLVSGFAFAQQNDPVDLSMDREPSIFSIKQPTVYF